jgi:type 1 glutamine amidotransferase
VAQQKIRVLIITGSHQVHDWFNTTPILKQTLETTGKFQVDVTEDPARDLAPANLKQYQALMLHYRETRPEAAQRWPILDQNYEPTGQFKEFPAKPGRWPAEAEKALLDAVSGGIGLVVVHYASSAFDTPAGVNWPEYENLIGGGWRASKGHSGHGPQLQFKVQVVNRDHPITKGFPAEFLHTKDELYHNSLVLDGSTLLATAFDDQADGARPTATGKNEPLIWARQFGKGRVYANMLAHGVNQMRLSPGYLSLIQRGTEWAATGAVTIPIPSVLNAPVDPVPMDPARGGRGRGAGAPGAGRATQ